MYFFLFHFLNVLFSLRAFRELIFYQGKAGPSNSWYFVSLLHRSTEYFTKYNRGTEILTVFFLIFEYRLLQYKWPKGRGRSRSHQSPPCFWWPCSAYTTAAITAVITRARPAFHGDVSAAWKPLTIPEKKVRIISKIATSGLVLLWTTKLRGEPYSLPSLLGPASHPLPGGLP